MTVSTYVVTVECIGSTDAPDFAKRRARADGFRVRTVKRVHPAAGFDGNPKVRGPWVVELAVSRSGG